MPEIINRYAFIDAVTGDIMQVMQWGDNRSLPGDYPIPEGIIVKILNDDVIDITYKYVSTTDTYVLKPYVEPSILGPTIQDQLTDALGQLATTKAAIDYILMNY